MSTPPTFRFEIAARETDGRARRGRVHTPHGSFATPAFMPVGTKASVKGLQIPDIESTGAEIILANTYHLHLRPGEDLVRDLGGLHRFMAWDRPILTDSGGYQVFSLSDLRRIDEDGVHFKSHLDGTPLFLSPRRAMEIQIALGSDIIMSFDECLPYPAEYGYAERSVDRTSRWEEETLRYHPRDGRALFGIVQGGVHADLRRRSARQLLDLPFDGYAMGGLFVGEPREETMAVLDLVAGLIPETYPRYVMGVGTPLEVIDCVILGWDMFDCVLPTRNARHGYAMHPAGMANLKNLRFRTDDRPIQEDCDCLACTRHSRAYLRHLLMARELLAQTLVTHHNLRFMQRTMEGLRRAIDEDRVASFRAAFAERWSGPFPADA
ncbi:MAG: tRNA guanosine(34) transglycosylase Tgt [Planctomycetota bacterium]